MNDSHAASDVSRELERLATLPWFESGKPCRTDVFQGGVDEDAHKCDIAPISSHHRHYVPALAHLNVTWALRIKVKPDQIRTHLHRSEGICHSFDSADFDFGHDFFNMSLQGGAERRSNLLLLANANRPESSV